MLMPCQCCQCSRQAAAPAAAALLHCLQLGCMLKLVSIHIEWLLPELPAG